MPRVRTDAAAGEVFRDDVRGRVGAALPPGALADLTRLDDVQSLRALAITLSSTVIVVGSAAWVWSPWVVLPAIVLVATRQHALFVLAHEAAHHRLFARRGLNEFAGRAIGGVTGISMCAYRVVHRLHHNDLYGPSDPDMALHGGYPRGRAYLLRKLAADLAGLTAWKTWRYFFGLPGVTQPGSGGGPLRPLDDTAPALRRAALHDRWAVVACQMLIPLGLVLAGGLDALLRYAVLWLLPMATVLQVLLRLRAIAEHGAPRRTDSPLLAARTHTASALGRLFLFPHNVHHHIEHHLFPAVPQYHLPALHALLAGQGLLEGAEVRRFGETWRRVYAPRAVGPAKA
jgi:fatty acid desaturase